MASVLKVDKLDPQSGTALEIGTSGDTITVPTGAGLTVVDEVKTNKVSPATGTAFALGDSGDTFTVPSGATIVNSGTATGFQNYFDSTAFSAYITSTQTPTSGVQTTLTFDAERFDLGSNFDTTTYEYTPPSTGYYVFNIAASFRGGANTNLARCNLSMAKGGSTFQDWEKNFSASYVLNACTAVSIFANVTNSDAFSVFVNITDQSGDPSVLGTITNSYFEGWRIA